MLGGRNGVSYRANVSFTVCNVMEGTPHLSHLLCEQQSINCKGICDA